MSKKNKKFTKQPPKPVGTVTETITASEINAGAAPVVSPANEKKQRLIFYASLIGMLLVTWIAGYDVGFHSDEIDMNNYARANWNYYVTGKTDTTFGKFTSDAALENSSENQIERGLDTALRYYGTAFEYLAVGLNKVTGLDDGPHEFNTRHALVQLFAILGILFAGLVACKIAGWRAAIFTEWLLFLTPVYFGNALFNSKDIPFSTGYIATIYFMMCYLEQLPKPTWKTTIAFMLAFAFTTGIRIGGLLLMFYLAVFMVLYIIMNKGLLNDIKRNVKQIGLQLLVVGVGGMILVVLSWPFLLESPVDHIIKTMEVVRKFPMNVKMPFEGEFINSNQAPQYYLVKFMAITIPVFMMVAFGLSFVTVLQRKKITDFKKELLILVAAVFPIVYAITTKMNLYSAWRHLLFVYPCMVIVTGVGIGTLYNALSKPVYKIALVAVCFVGMLHPITWSIKNHPFEYAYFNEAEGGFKSAYNNYEMDYWGISMKPAVDWLFKHENLMNRKDTVIITTNAVYFVKYYIAKHYPNAKVKLKKRGFRKRSYGDWTYAILNNTFLPTSMLENDFPPGGTVHTVNIDGLPVTAVLKDTNRFAYKGILEVQAMNYAKADSLFKLYYYTVDSNDAAMYGFMGIAKGLTNDNRAAIEFGQRMIAYDENDYLGYIAVTIAYLNMNQLNTAVPYLEKAYFLNPNDEYVKTLVANLQKAGLIQLHQNK